MNNLFPLNVRKIGNIAYANDNYSLSTEQSIIARATNAPATATRVTTTATVNLKDHGYLVDDVVTLVGVDVFNGAVTITAVNQNSFNYTCANSGVLLANITVTVVTLNVNEYTGSTAAPTKYTITQTLATLRLAAPEGSFIPVTVVGEGSTSTLWAIANPFSYSALLFTGKVVNMRRVTSPTISVNGTTTGSFARTLTTVTVTVAAGHGLQVGDWITVDATTAALDGTYAVATVTSPTVFTYTTTSSGSVSAEAGTLYRDYTKIHMYEEGAENNQYLVNEVYSTLTPYLQTFDTNHVPVAVNATATLTAAQVALGYITSTSAAAVTMTMPTGTLLGAAIGAKQGTVLDLYIDNTAGSNTVTVAVGTNAILSDGAAAAPFSDLTIASGVTGVGKFTLMFSSPTAYVFSRAS